MQREFKMKSIIITSDIVESFPIHFIFLSETPGTFAEVQDERACRYKVRMAWKIEQDGQQKGQAA